MSSLLILLIDVDQNIIEVVFLEHVVELGQLERVGIIGVKFIEDAFEFDTADFVLRLVKVVGLDRVAVARQPLVHAAAVVVGPDGRHFEVGELIGDSVLDFLWLANL
jgi:hypothetical protein